MTCKHGLLLLAIATGNTLRTQTQPLYPFLGRLMAIVLRPTSLRLTCAAAPSNYDPSGVMNGRQDRWIPATSMRRDWPLTKTKGCQGVHGHAHRSAAPSLFPWRL